MEIYTLVLRICNPAKLLVREYGERCLFPLSQTDSILALLNQLLQRLRQDQAIGGHNPFSPTQDQGSKTLKRADEAQVSAV